MVANRSAWAVDGPSDTESSQLQRSFAAWDSSRVSVPYGVAVQPDNEPIPAAKARLRTGLIVARRARGDDERRSARAANSAHLLTALARVITAGGQQERPCIAAYLPLPTEPLDGQLLDELAVGCRVLVPLVTGTQPLDWCDYPVPLRRGALGISEPNGLRLGPNAIADADVVLVPALAVDLRGHRLGRGGGHYDRTLQLQAQLLGPAYSPASAQVGALRGSRIAVLYDDELLEVVPADQLDQLVSATLTPRAGLLPRS